MQKPLQDYIYINMWWLLLVTMIILFYFDARAKKCLKGLSGPKTVPILGNALDVFTATDFFVLCNRLWHEYGSRYRAFVFNQAFIMISDPKDIDVVMASNDFNERGDEYYFLKQWLGNGILLTTGDEWKVRRKMITPMFNIKIQDKLIDVINRQTDSLIDVLVEHVDGEAVDVLPLMSRCALDIIVESTIAKSVNAQTNSKLEIVDAMETVREIFFKRAFGVFLRSDIIFRFTKDFSKNQRALNVINGFLKNIIEDRKKTLEESKESIESYTDDDTKKNLAFMDILLLTKLHGKSLDEKGILDEIKTLLFAGNDTVKIAISFTLYLISNHPCVQQKLLDEQSAIFCDDFKKETTTSDLSKMKYLDMVIREALRLYPPAPIIPRYTSKDTMINDIHVPRGTSIVMLIYNMHRDPKVFPDPDKFIPERFSQEEPVLKSEFAPLPFSGAPRTCIGQRFAMMEVKACISKIIREYELLPSYRAFELRITMTLTTDKGLFVKFKKRQQKAM